ncbi:MAG: bifunctional hydroxymethylpyrimidine kinase/phosphomethylpyrimidine kinase [Prevotellaceae bacterium]|nr:bifunctional hydroxymethylpyrimidine kinase/phosphomethylpyrimidine kinase [Prevotellaceae bacterium]
MKRHYRRVLTIAGSDPSGGAGIQADLKTIAACECYGASAIVAVVDENTQGVTGIHEIPVDFVTGQIHSVLDDIGADAIKIGMLHSSELILAVKHAIAPYKIVNTVLDPVMVATSGDRLLRDDAIETLRKELIPSVRVITPNIPEAEVLLGCKISCHKDLIDVVRDLSMDKKVSVLLKAGHLEEKDSADVFYNAETDEIIELRFMRIDTKNTHGTGCTLSSAIAAYLTHGLSLDWAVRKAKDYVNMAIFDGAYYTIGKGNGPIHHFYKYWK